MVYYVPMQVLESLATFFPVGHTQTPPSSDGLQSCSHPRVEQREVAARNNKEIISLTSEEIMCQVQARKCKYYLQQASFSSAPSSQSLVPSHSLALSMHLGVALGPPLGQTNLFSGQVMAVQLLSSVPSVQSL